VEGEEEKKKKKSKKKGLPNGQGDDVEFAIKFALCKENLMPTGAHISFANPGPQAR